MPNFVRLMWGTLALLLGVAHSASAQDDRSFLDPDAIRAAYASASASWTDSPEVFLQAVIAAEDRKFHERAPGLSVITSYIALWYPEPGRRRNMVISFAIAQALSRDEILDWYSHEIYFGRGCFGIDDSARAYFAKDADALVLHEVAFLAGLIKSPASYQPDRDAERALMRRNFVLSEMARAGFITEEQAQTAVQEPLAVADPPGRCEAALSGG